MVAAAGAEEECHALIFAPGHVLKGDLEWRIPGEQGLLLVRGAVAMDVDGSFVRGCCEAPDRRCSSRAWEGLASGRGGRCPPGRLCGDGTDAEHLALIAQARGLTESRLNPGCADILSVQVPDLQYVNQENDLLASGQ